MFRTLRGRLVLLVCLATLPALLFTFYAASVERTSVLKRIEKDTSLLAQLASREHAHQLEGAKSLVERLAGVLDEARPGIVARCPDYWPALLAGYPQFTTIGLLATDGRLLCSAHPAPPAVDFAGNAAFVRALASRGVEMGDYTIGPIVGRPVLHLAMAVREPDGAPRFVVFVGLDLRWLEQLARQAVLPPGEALFIADQHGHVLARSTDAGEDAPDLSRLVSSPRGVASAAAVGRHFLVAAPMTGIPGVSVVASLPYDRVYGEANRVFYRTVAGLTLLTLFTIACALFAAEISVLRVLRLLSRTARRFGGGDLAARAEVSSGRGELSELVAAFNTMADDLERRQREAAETQDELRELSQRLAVARESEAGRIARELHDELGQVLTSIKIDLAMLQKKHAAAADGGPAAEALRIDVAGLNDRLDEAVAFVRRIAGDLRPPVLDRLGLAAALEAQVREFALRTRVDVGLDVERSEEPVDWLTSITVFRIVQEGLTNITRHAGATEASIALRAARDAYLLTLRDNGKGIDREAIASARSLGIAGMRERCVLVGGALTITGEPGQGTTITARIPRRVTEESHAHAPG